MDFGFQHSKMKLRLRTVRIRMNLTDIIFSKNNFWQNLEKGQRGGKSQWIWFWSQIDREPSCPQIGNVFSDCSHSMLNRLVTLALEWA